MNLPPTRLASLLTRVNLDGAAGAVFLLLALGASTAVFLLSSISVMQTGSALALVGLIFSAAAGVAVVRTMASSSGGAPASTTSFMCVALSAMGVLYGFGCRIGWVRVTLWGCAGLTLLGLAGYLLRTKRARSRELLASKGL